MTRLYPKMRMVFTLSTINPYTGKQLRAYRKNGINGFIHECYTEKTAENNRFMADHTVFCECGEQHLVVGFASTPSAAYNDCIKDIQSFVCPDKE